MAADASRPRLRLTVAGLPEGTFDRSPEDIGEDPGPMPQVRPVARSNADRAAGQHRYEVTVDGWVFAVLVEPSARALLRERAGQGAGREGIHGDQVVKAQIPGRVVRLWIAEGDTVEAGQRLLAIEAMKMENEVRAPRGGTIASLKVAVQGSVELGDELLTVELG